MRRIRKRDRRTKRSDVADYDLSKCVCRVVIERELQSAMRAPVVAELACNPNRNWFRTVVRRLRRRNDVCVKRRFAVIDLHVVVVDTRCQRDRFGVFRIIRIRQALVPYRGSRIAARDGHLRSGRNRAGRRRNLQSRLGVFARAFLRPTEILEFRCRKSPVEHGKTRYGHVLRRLDTGDGSIPAHAADRKAIHVSGLERGIVPQRRGWQGLAIGGDIGRRAARALVVNERKRAGGRNGVGAYRVVIPIVIGC